MKVRRLIANDFSTAWQSGCNVLLTPTTLSDAPSFEDFVNMDEREQCASQDYCTQPANMSGTPKSLIVEYINLTYPHQS